MRKLHRNADTVLADLILTTRADCTLTSVCRVVAVVNRRSAQPAEMINFVSAVTKGIKISDKEHAALAIERDAFHGEWNYRLQSRMIAVK